MGKFVTRTRLPGLPIRTRHIRTLARLPAFHTDPFDGILLAQALVESLTVLSKDAVFTQCGASGWGCRRTDFIREHPLQRIESASSCSSATYSCTAVFPGYIRSLFTS